MIQPSHKDEPDNELQIITTSLPSPNLDPPSAYPAWFKQARIICAVIYVLLQTAYFIFIIVCIATYPRCEKASPKSWWMNGVFLRFSNRAMGFRQLDEKLNEYKTNFSAQVIWLSTVLPLSEKLNPLDWKGVDNHLGGEKALTSLIKNAHKNNLQIIADYPINHLSVQSKYFTSYDHSYFVWNEQGNSSNWMTINDNQQSAWTYNDKKNSFYLHQFNQNNDSIDVNYRNNRVFNEIIDSVTYWNTKFQFDGFNLQGISYAYEDYEYKNETYGNSSRRRHLDEDFLLLARIRSEVDTRKILLLDSIDSLHTSDESLLQRYFGDKSKYLGGVQLASLQDFILVNESQTNITMIFAKYYDSVFFNKRPLIWSSLSSNAKLNEAFYAACLFYNGSIFIDVDQQGKLDDVQLGRLRQIIKLAQTLDVFRDGAIVQRIISRTQFVTIERKRRGSKHHMIIVNFGKTTQEGTIRLEDGKTDAVEVLLTNKASGDKNSESNTLIDVTQPIKLNSYEYIIIRWSASIQKLKLF